MQLPKVSRFIMDPKSHPRRHIKAPHQDGKNDQGPEPRLQRTHGPGPWAQVDDCWGAKPLPLMGCKTIISPKFKGLPKMSILYWEKWWYLILWNWKYSTQISGKPKWWLTRYSLRSEHNGPDSVCRTRSESLMVNANIYIILQEEQLLVPDQNLTTEQCVNAVKPYIYNVPLVSRWNPVPIFAQMMADPVFIDIQYITVGERTKSGSWQSLCFLEIFTKHPSRSTADHVSKSFLCSSFKSPSFKSIRI